MAGQQLHMRCSLMMGMKGMQLRVAGAPHSAAYGTGMWGLLGWLLLAEGAWAAHVAHTQGGPLYLLMTTCCSYRRSKASRPLRLLNHTLLECVEKAALEAIVHCSWPRCRFALRYHTGGVPAWRYMQGS